MHDAVRGVCVKATEHPIKSVGQLLQLLQLGLANRIIASTSMNAGNQVGLLFNAPRVPVWWYTRVQPIRRCPLESRVAIGMAMHFRQSLLCRTEAGRAENEGCVCCRLVCLNFMWEYKCGLGVTRVMAEFLCVTLFQVLTHVCTCKSLVDGALMTWGGGDHVCCYCREQQVALPCLSAHQ
jgi:hypothetical protein